jgi:4-amino-4-deoxy-L-arabinose transferase-like glycosyltransferase
VRLPGSFQGRLALIAAGGLLIRLVYLFAFARGVHGIGDWYFFHWGANLLAQGHGFINPLTYVFHGQSVASAGHPPAWQVLLSGVSWVGGTGQLAHRATGCVVGAVTIVLVGLLARRVAGERVGVVAAGMAAVYPVLIGADISLMSETLYGFFVAAALLVAYRLRDRRDLGSAAGLGALIALAALTRSEGLLLIVLLALPVALRAGGGRRFLLSGACVAACALVIAPWAIRNAVVFHRFVPLSTNDGTLVAGANCGLTYRGADIGFWNIQCIPPQTWNNEAVQAARWRHDGVTYARRHTGRWPVVVATRVLRTWDLFQPRRMVRFNEGRPIRLEQASLLAFWLLVPFAIAGLVTLRRRREPLWILLSPIVLVTIASVIGYGTPRFRHAAEIPLLVFGGVAVTRVLDWAQAHGWARPRRSAPRPAAAR